MLATFMLVLSLAVPGIPADEPARDSDSGETRLACDLGPITRSYGGGDWQVYGCADAKSVVAVAGSRSRAFPFYFMVTPEGEGIRLNGEGTGDQAATRAAFKDLNALSSSDVAALYAETLKVGRGSSED